MLAYLRVRVLLAGLADLVGTNGDAGQTAVIPPVECCTWANRRSAGGIPAGRIQVEEYRPPASPFAQSYALRPTHIGEGAGHVPELVDCLTPGQAPGHASYLVHGFHARACAR